MVMIPNAPRVGDMPKGDPVPEGVYHLRLEKATYKTTGQASKNPGAPMAECQFVIFGPEEAEEYVGRKIFENFMLSGEGMFRTRQFLTSSGADDDFVLEDTDQLQDRECAGVVQVQEESKGADGKLYPARNKIARFMPIE